MRVAEGGVEGEEFLDIKWWDEWKPIRALPSSLNFSLCVYIIYLDFTLGFYLILKVYPLLSLICLMLILDFFLSL
jgi:hypothetical protein